MTPALIIEPPRKAVRWVFLPTLVIGAGALLLGGLPLLPGGRGLPLVGAAVAVPMGSAMVALALWALTYRGRFTVDVASQVITIERHSALGRRVQTRSFAEYTAVRLQRVDGQSRPGQLNIVGTYWMVVLDGEQPTHVASDRWEEAERMAAQLSNAMGLPVVGKPEPVVSG